MITVDKAVALITKYFPNRKVAQVSDYKGNYLVTAPEKKLFGLMPDVSDPFFLVDKNTGVIKPFIPTMDLAGFQDSTVNRVLKMFN